MPYIFLAVRCIIMKRRTFLRLSSAALASLGLSACGAKTAASSSSGSAEPDGPYDEVGDEELSFGMSLAMITTVSILSTAQMVCSTRLLCH